MTPPISINSDAATRSKAFYDAVVVKLREQQVLQRRFPYLSLNDWGVFSFPGLMGNNLDGSTARFTFTLSGFDVDLDKAEEELKHIPYFLIVGRAPLVLHCCSPLCCVLDMPTRGSFEEWLETYVLGPLRVTK